MMGVVGVVCVWMVAAAVLCLGLVARADSMDQQGELMLAVSAGDLEQTRRLIEDGAEVNAADPRGTTPLIMAVEQNNNELAQFLLSSGAKANVIPPNPKANKDIVWPPLHEAIWNNNTELVDALAKAGADLNLIYWGYGTLIQAANFNNTEVVEVLLDAGASPDAGPSWQKKPLTLAVIHDNMEMAKLLLRSGAGLDAQSFLKERTALMYAVIANNTEMVAVLLDAGANVNTRDDDGNSVLTQARKHGSLAIKNLLKNRAIPGNYNSKKLLEAATNGQWDEAEKLLADGPGIFQWRTYNGRTALMIAAGANQTNIAAKMLDTGAEPDYLDYQASCALFEAVTANSEKMVEVLIKGGADVNLQGTNQRLTSLMMAASQQGIGIVVTLLANGANPDIQNINGWTALRFAVEEQEDSVEVVTALLAAGADPNRIDSEGDTPLLQATIKNNTRLVAVLVEAGADVNIRNNRGDSVLMYATRYGNADMVKVLVEASAELDLIGFRNYGSENTALMLAAFWNKSDTAMVLLDAGADVNIINEEGQTALYKAKSKGNKVLGQILLDGGATPDELGDQLVDAAREGNKASVLQLLEAGASPRARDWDGKTAMIIAASQGRSDIMEALVNEGKGEGLELYDKDDKTALYYAVEGNHTEATRVLTKEKVSVEKYMDSPLRIAVQKNNIAIMQLLIEAGADLENFYMLQASTPLIDACNLNRPELVRILLQAGAKPEAHPIRNESTPLMVATIFGHTEVIHALLEGGADVNYATSWSDGEVTALLVAARRRQEEVLEIFLSAGAEVDKVDEFGWSALMYAARGNQRSMAVTLLQKGASVNLKNVYNETALSITLERKHTVIQDMLESHGAILDGSAVWWAWLVGAIMLLLITSVVLLAWWRKQRL